MRECPANATAAGGMTRYARGGDANKKKPHDASSWTEMKADLARAGKAKRAPAGQSGDESKVISRLKNGQFMVQIGSYQKVFKTEKELKRWKRARTEKRRDHRKQQRQQARVCFNCRQSGHLVGECPAAGAASASAVCFRCGASDHALSACPNMPKRPAAQPVELPYAKCFVCNKSGHLSRSCPDNPKGLYPNGGGCLLCSSVEHFKRDCPLLQKQKAEAPSVSLPTTGAADDEVPLVEESPAADGVAPKRRKKSKVKVVLV